MKKVKYLLLVCAFTLTSLTTLAAESTDPKKEIDPKERAEQLKKRVYEIWEMDFSDMDKEEKTEIKLELKEIKKEIKKTNGLDSKVSISIGAIIIILLLIIIIS